MNEIFSGEVYNPHGVAKPSDVRDDSLGKPSGKERGEGETCKGGGPDVENQLYRPVPRGIGDTHSDFFG